MGRISRTGRLPLVSCCPNLPPHLASARPTRAWSVALLHIPTGVHFRLQATPARGYRMSMHSHTPLICSEEKCFAPNVQNDFPLPRGLELVTAAEQHTHRKHCFPGQRTPMVVGRLWLLLPLQGVPTTPVRQKGSSSSLDFFFFA